MKRYIALFAILCTLPSIAFAQDTDVVQCSGENTIDCIISNFKEKKNVSGAIDSDNSVTLTFDNSNKQIIFVLQNTAQKQLKECKAESSAFFKIQSTLESIQEGATPDVSYMECIDKEIAGEASDTVNAENPLKIENFEIINTTTIVLSFNQDIQYNTVGVRVVNRDNYSMVPVKNYSKNDSKSVNITLEEALLADAEYSLTVTTAISESQATIERGIDSVQTFTTPADLDGAPNAQKEEISELEEILPPEESEEASQGEQVEMEYSKSYPEGKPVESQENELDEETATGQTEQEIIEDAKTSVETGVNATILMIGVALGVAGILALRRRRF